MIYSARFTLHNLLRTIYSAQFTLQYGVTSDECGSVQWRPVWRWSGALPRSDPTTDDLKSRVEFAGGTTVIRVK